MIIGQSKVRDELDILAQAYLRGENLNILLAGPSGYGKTTLALHWANRVSRPNDYWYTMPDSTGCISAPDNKRLLLFDEIHTYLHPELLYPLLDGGARTFVLMTNQAGDLKEPLVNRCIRLELMPYTHEEIAQICSYIVDLPRDWLLYLAEISSGNPRVAKQLATRLAFYFRVHTYPASEELFHAIVEDYLSYHDGMSPMQSRYMEYLSRVKRSSLSGIVNGTRMSQEDILRDVEPALLYRGLIQITSRGREVKDG